jgi:hypothetical protein
MPVAKVYRQQVPELKRSQNRYRRKMLELYLKFALGYPVRSKHLEEPIIFGM